MTDLLRPPLLSSSDSLVRSLLAIEREAHSLFTDAQWGDVNVLRRLEAAHLIETLRADGDDSCEAWLTDAGWRVIGFDSLPDAAGPSGRTATD